MEIKTESFPFIVLILRPSIIYTSCPILLSLEVAAFMSLNCLWFDNFQKFAD